MNIQSTTSREQSIINNALAIAQSQGNVESDHYLGIAIDNMLNELTQSVESSDPLLTDRIRQAVAIGKEYRAVEGTHHKDWTISKIVFALTQNHAKTFEIKQRPGTAP